MASHTHSHAHTHTHTHTHTLSLSLSLSFSLSVCLSVSLSPTPVFRPLTHPLPLPVLVPLPLLLPLSLPHTPPHPFWFCSLASPPPVDLSLCLAIGPNIAVTADSCSSQSPHFVNGPDPTHDPEPDAVLQTSLKDIPAVQTPSHAQAPAPAPTSPEPAEREQPAGVQQSLTEMPAVGGGARANGPGGGPHAAPRPKKNLPAVKSAAAGGRSGSGRHSSPKTVANPAGAGAGDGPARSSSPKTKPKPKPRPKKAPTSLRQIARASTDPGPTTSDPVSPSVHGELDSVARSLKSPRPKAKAARVAAPKAQPDVTGGGAAARKEAKVRARPGAEPPTEARPGPGAADLDIDAPPIVTVRSRRVWAASDSARVPDRAELFQVPRVVVEGPSPLGGSSPVRSRTDPTADRTGEDLTAGRRALPRPSGVCECQGGLGRACA